MKYTRWPEYFGRLTLKGSPLQVVVWTAGFLIRQDFEIMHFALSCQSTDTGGAWLWGDQSMRLACKVVVNASSYWIDLVWFRSRIQIGSQYRWMAASCVGTGYTIEIESSALPGSKGSQRQGAQEKTCYVVQRPLIWIGRLCTGICIFLDVFYAIAANNPQSYGKGVGSENSIVNIIG
jgi:hypothetical protein